ncbi:hypothetical protein [Streptomyces guryensis]|uniref:Uncharacterized protein n=1 Tax=Streptomyces guryensis TaxID=2886947 RepID=A0A9Q3VPS1_9ACTN|nr:hypothetical protein [Streptomyces guryensis]MCD9875434.1 hypothetical protein [Streptomyces guryensis]
MGVDEIEPLLEDLLLFLKRHDECRAAMEVRFRQILDSLPPGGVEIVQYCMFEFRWPGVREYAKELFAGTRDVLRRQSYRRIIEAFSDDWPERVIYSRYTPELDEY